MKLFTKIMSLFVVAMLALATPALAKKRYIFGGGPAGGTFQTVANAIQVYKPIKDMADISIKAQSSGGSVENLRTVNAGRVDFATVLTEKELIVWGGHWPRSWPNTTREDYSWNDGAILDLKKNEWRKISTENAPPAHHGMASVWTGELMLMYGGSCYDGQTYRIFGDQVFAYDPKADKWVSSHTHIIPPG